MRLKETANMICAATALVSEKMMRSRIATEMAVEALIPICVATDTIAASRKPSAVGVIEIKNAKSLSRDAINTHSNDGWIPTDQKAICRRQVRISIITA